MAISLCPRRADATSCLRPFPPTVEARLRSDGRARRRKRRDSRLTGGRSKKNVPGRKTDKADARWLAKLMRYDLLQASFVPPKGQRDLRDLTRYRIKLVQEWAHEG